MDAIFRSKRLKQDSPGIWSFYSALHLHLLYLLTRCNQSWIQESFGVSIFRPALCRICPKVSWFSWCCRIILITNHAICFGIFSIIKAPVWHYLSICLVHPSTIERQKRKRSDSVLRQNRYTYRKIQKATWQHKNADTTTADRLRTVSWGNDCHPIGVVKPVYGIQTLPLSANTNA